MTGLRVVGPGGAPPDPPIADEARALLERVLAEGAVTVMIAWETPARIHWESVPRADVIERGFIECLGDSVFPFPGASA